MLRFYSRFALIPIALFTVALLLIHAQPYDDHELRSLLLPDGCPSPCFIGIRPGVTTADEAAAILKSSQWIGKLVDAGGYSLELRNLSWDWSDQKPTWIVESARGYADAAGGYITSMTIETHFSLGAVRLAFGAPDWETVGALGDNKYGFYSGFYRQYGIFIQQTFACNGIEPFKGNVSVRLVPRTNPTPLDTSPLTDIFRVC
jgi:hypothetical protein